MTPDSISLNEISKEYFARFQWSLGESFQALLKLNFEKAPWLKPAITLFIFAGLLISVLIFLNSITKMRRSPQMQSVPEPEEIAVAPHPTANPHSVLVFDKQAYPEQIDPVTNRAEVEVAMAAAAMYEDYLEAGDERASIW